MHEDAPTVTDESRIFIEKLAASNIWVLAIGMRGRPDLRGLDGPTRRQALAAHRIELADVGPGDSIAPFRYGQGERQVLPFFSSEECARDFQAQLLRGANGPFQPYRILAGFVTAPGNEKYDLILDPGSPSKRKLQPEEKALLRKITSASKFSSRTSST